MYVLNPHGRQPVVPSKATGLNSTGQPTTATAVKSVPHIVNPSQRKPLAPEALKRAGKIR